MKVFEDRIRRRSFWVLSFFFVLLAIFFALPFEIWQGIPLCTIKAVTGWPCPGCGLTRGMWHFWQGHFVAAIRLNALTPVFSLILALYLWNHILTLKGSPSLQWKSSRGQRLIGPLLLLLLVGQGLSNLYRYLGL